MKDEYYWLTWGIDFPKLDDALTLNKDRLYEIFDHYKTVFSSKSFTKDEYKTKYFKIKKDQDLQVDGFCDKVFKTYAKDGKINFEDFAEVMNVQFFGKVAEKLSLLFDLTDQDFNGLLSEKELTDMLTAYYNKIDEPDPRKKASDLAQRIILKGSDGVLGSEISLAKFQLATHSQDIFSEVYKLFQPGFPAGSKLPGEPPFHWMMRMEKYDICLRLLLNNTDPNWKDDDGNAALHIAAKEGKVDYVKMLIAFGADVNIENAKKLTARHLAATSNQANKDEINTLLYNVGASSCSVPGLGCQPNCSSGEFEIDDFHDQIRNDFETIFSGITDNDAIDETDYPTDGIGVKKEKTIGDMVLCLDGGGVRGLVLIQILMAIEKKLSDGTGKTLKIREYFDWIGGTSTGGILALAIARGISSYDCRRLYFQLKDSVFGSGDVETQTKQLVTLLKRTFGNELKLTDEEMVKDKPKIILTTVRMSIDDEQSKPAVLRLLRNYAAPDYLVGSESNTEYAKDAPIDHVWKAAQATSAAPRYFERVDGKFVDGGLMANNPTLDVMTDIMEYRIQNAKNKTAKKNISIGAVVSLGTGQIPNKGLLVSLEPILNFVGFKELKETVQFLINEATKADGTKVARSKAWCESLGIPYVRLNPHFKEHIDLAERDNKTLVVMLYNTAVYVHKHSDKINETAQLLLKRYKQHHPE